MEHARDVYETRVDEIELYFGFITQVIDRNAMLSLRVPFEQGQEGRRDPDQRELAPIPSGVVDTLKANGFLLLYNMVESTVRQIMHAIRRDIDRHGYRFDDLSEALQKYFTELMRHDDIRGEVNKRQREHKTPLAKAILEAGFEANKLGGNIHHETLEKLGKKFGFELGEAPKLVDSNIDPLRHVKDQRNHLAHGSLAFFACGKETPIDQIVAIKNEVVAYLAHLLDIIEAYVDDKGYLPKQPAEGTPQLA